MNAIARTTARARRVWRLGRRAVWHGAIAFYKSNNLTFAASIAYYTLLSLFPFALLVLSILNRVTVGGNGNGPNEQTLLEIIGRALPSQFDFVGTQFEALGKMSFSLSIAGTLIMLWASMGVFGAVTSAVNHAWGVERSYSFFKHKLVAFVMMVAAGLLTVTALTLIGTGQLVQARWFSEVLSHVPALAALNNVAYRNAPTLIFILVVGLIYYFIPNARVRLRDVWIGAIVAGLLWQGAFAGFAWWVRDLSRFNVHGSIAAVIVFLLWIYLSAVILLYGAGVTASYARLRKHIPQEAPAAPPIES